MPKFLHAADLHLDSPLLGLEAYEGAPAGQLRDATRRALRNLVDLAIKERVAGLVLAGDIYDTNPLASTVLYFRSQMQRLEVEGIKVAIVRGNHDHEKIGTTPVQMPKNVHVFPSLAPGSEDRTKPFELAPGLVVHGRSYAVRDESQDLVDRYADPVEGFNIGLLHTALAGAPGHACYAPTSLSTLRAKGYQYWALGHVHKACTWKDGTPVVFPGNLQGRHACETGSKGATLVTYTGKSVQSIDHVPLDVVRWFSIEVPEAPLEELAHAIAAHTEAARADGRLCAARITVKQARDATDAVKAQRPGLREALIGQLQPIQDSLWIEKVVLQGESSAGDGALYSRLADLARECAVEPGMQAGIEEDVRALDTMLRRIAPALAKAAVQRTAGANLQSSDTSDQSSLALGFLPKAVDATNAADMLAGAITYLRDVQR